MAYTLLYGTYYVGVVLCGLLVLYLLMSVRALGRRTIVLSSAVVLVSAAITASDPLFVTHVGLPLCAASCSVLRHRHCRSSSMIAVVGAACLALGMIGGMVLRTTVVEDWIGIGLGSYLDGVDVDRSVERLWGLVESSLDSRLQRYEAIYLLVLVMVCVARPIWLSFGNRASSMSRSGLLLADFAAWSIFGIIGAQIISGTVLARYLGAMTVFPLLSLVTLRAPAWVSPPSAAARVSTWVACAVIVGVALRGLASFGLVSQLAGSRPAGQACLAESVERQETRDGVAFFWRARALDAYSSSVRVLQVHSNFVPYIWLANRGAYVGRDFSFVLVDVDQRVYPGLVASDVISALGSPVTVDACGQFEVWSYPPGSDGHDQLNRRIDDWLASG